MGLGSVGHEILGLRTGRARLEVLTRRDPLPPSASPTTIGALALLCLTASETASTALVGGSAPTAVARGQVFAAAAMVLAYYSFSACKMICATCAARKKPKKAQFLWR